MTPKDYLYFEGTKLLNAWCILNDIQLPEIVRLSKTDRLYHLATCAYYRSGIIRIMVEKCASPGKGGRAWSWPGYAIDRTAYGVLQHELGHHVDEAKSSEKFLFSNYIWQQSKEPPLTGYLGTDKETSTFYKEWFAENFRLFVTNPDLCLNLRPKFYWAMSLEFRSVTLLNWETTLEVMEATPRIIEMARKKISQG